MRVGQVGQHFNLRTNFELYKRHHYPIIPFGMWYNIKGRWQPATTLVTTGVVSLVYAVICDNQINHTHHIQGRRG